MSDLNLVTLGAVKLVKGVPTVQALSPITDGSDDVEQYGEIEMISQLGVAACPAEADESGQAQGVVCENLGGTNAVCVGAIDRRNASVYGNLGPGDTAVFSTGPKGVSQCLLKAEKRQAILATLGTDDKQILVVLDGKNNTLQITAFGQMFELSKENGISLTDGGAGIRIHNGTLQLLGNLVVGQGAQQALAIALVPKTGSPGGPASAPLVPLLGCSV